MYLLHILYEQLCIFNVINTNFKISDLTFVISGVLDSLERDDCKDLVVKYGGRVTGSVSGKTSYLIIGDEPGESKVKKAVQLKVPQISEDDLLEMIRKSNPNANSQDSGLAYSEDMMSCDSEQIKTEDEDAYDADKSLFSSPANTTPRKSSRTVSPRKHERSPSKLAMESPSKKLKTDTVKKEDAKKGKELETEKKQEKKEIPDKKIPQPSTSASSVPVPAQSTLPPDAGLMWVDKYKPKNLKNVVGQTSETSNAKKLVKWLQNWFKYHGSSQVTTIQTLIKNFISYSYCVFYLKSMSGKEIVFQLVFFHDRTRLRHRGLDSKILKARLSKPLCFLDHLVSAKQHQLIWLSKKLAMITLS